MATTTYFDATFAVRAISDRTDAAGTPAAADLTAEEDRLSHEFVTEGWVAEANSYAPTEGLEGTMLLNIGSDGARDDYYVVAGDATGQGKYVARLAAKTGVPIDTASPSLPRKDEVYLVIEDNIYDSNARSLARLGYRTGTPSVSPVAPGPDGGWNAYVLLATVEVPAGAPDIGATTITDERTQSQLVVDAATLDGRDAAYFSTAGHAHGGDYAPIAHEGDTVGHPEATTSDSGFMDSADQTKLDAIEASAEVNPTDAELLTQLKNVDGATSGIDADLLDGSHGSALATTGHAHGSEHYTEAESNSQLSGKRNKAEGTFLRHGTFAGTHTTGGLFLVPITIIDRDDWGGAPTLPGAPGAGSAVIDIPTTGGTYLIYGQIAFSYVNTTGVRQAQIESASSGVIGVSRKKSISGDVTIVQVSAVHTSASGADEAYLKGYHTAGTNNGLTGDTWFRVVALDNS
jgi:hypothetical protein